MIDSDTDQISRSKLLKAVLVKFISAIILLAVMFFLPAGSIEYWNAWIYIITLSLCMTVTLIYLFIKDPALLEKRMQLKEKEKEQKVYVKLSFLIFLISFLIPGFDYRYKLSNVPLSLVFIAVGCMIIGYILFVFVMKQNSYASRVIEIQDKQKLIDTGLYSIVRHPMYMSASIIYIASPIVLGSYYGLIPILFLPVLLGYRIKNEEKVLMAGLEGYEEYTKHVKYRLIPFIW
jgi:protein-S-isoprenylcysteine O-methyltransferase Ste14